MPYANATCKPSLWQIVRPLLLLHAQYHPNIVRLGPGEDPNVVDLAAVLEVEQRVVPRPLRLLAEIDDLVKFTLTRPRRGIAPPN